MERNSTRDLARTAVFTALVAAATMAVQVPMPATEGFVNVGDTVIFVTALLLGPVPALAAGGLGGRQDPRPPLVHRRGPAGRERRHLG